MNLDTGNFHGEDPYAEIAELAPYAVNVQVKTEIRRKGKAKEEADLARVDRHPPRRASTRATSSSNTRPPRTRSRPSRGISRGLRELIS